MANVGTRQLGASSARRATVAGQERAMADKVEVTGSEQTTTGAEGPKFGLPQAMALIIGSIIGVGIFNLPTSLASYGPITLISMALTTVGALALAMLFAALSRRLPADGGPYA